MPNQFSCRVCHIIENRMQKCSSRSRYTELWPAIEQNLQRRCGTARNSMKIETHAPDCCFRFFYDLFQAVSWRFCWCVWDSTFLISYILRWVDRQKNERFKLRAYSFLKMPNTRHYYIFLKLHAFREIICDWIVNVTDSYIFHSQLLEGPFVLSDFFNQIAVFCKSDEKKDNATVFNGDNSCDNESDQDARQ